MLSKKISSYLLFLCFSSSYSMQQTNEPRQCMIIQDKQTLVLPQHGIPDFLKNRNKEMCQIRDSNSKALRCGNTGVSIKSECVCSFFNVYEGTYHSYSSCPGNVKSDDVRLLRCIDCVKYSLPNKGPCINGGNLTCKETGPDVKAPDIKCDCPPGFMGMFCENKMEKVTRICDRIENASTHNLKNCDVTKMDCITYSERKEYSFKCSEKSATTQQGQITLPLCSETEMHHTSLPNTVVTIDSAVNNRRRQPNPQYISGGKAMTSTLSITLFNVYALLQI